VEIKCNSMKKSTTEQNQMHWMQNCASYATVNSQKTQEVSTMPIGLFFYFILSTLAPFKIWNLPGHFQNEMDLASRQKCRRKSQKALLLKLASQSAIFGK
jgi:hypothetical protein